jgi:shikimate dehydrogenase
MKNKTGFEKLLKKSSLSGLNVTIPFKEEIIPFLDELSLEAQEIGAVNTVQFKKGKFIGHNTDVFGFKQMIKPFFQSHHEKALILGTGGAAKAVAYVLDNLGCQVNFISRSPNAENVFSYEEVNEIMLDTHKMLINTTPLGMYPAIDAYPKIPYKYLTPKHLVIDLIYNPIKTRFLAHAEKEGSVILNGRTMLEQQAEKSWEIWHE